MQPPIKMPIATAIAWGAFLHAGLMKEKSSQQVLAKWNQGCIALIQELPAIIKLVWQEMHSHWSQCQGTTGEFESEVINPLGRYLAKYIISHDGALPSEAETRSVIQSLLRRYFKS